MSTYAIQIPFEEDLEIPGFGTCHVTGVITRVAGNYNGIGHFEYHGHACFDKGNWIIEEWDCLIESIEFLNGKMTIVYDITQDTEVTPIAIAARTAMNELAALPSELLANCYVAAYAAQAEHEQDAADYRAECERDDKLERDKACP